MRRSHRCSRSLRTKQPASNSRRPRMWTCSSSWRCTSTTDQRCRSPRMKSARPLLPWEQTLLPQRETQCLLRDHGAVCHEIPPCSEMQTVLFAAAGLCVESVDVYRKSELPASEVTMHSWLRLALCCIKQPVTCVIYGTVSDWHTIVMGSIHGRDSTPARFPC